MTVLTRIRNASRYVQTRKSGITATEQQLIQFAAESTQAFTQAVTTFFETEWVGFVNQMAPHQKPVLSKTLSPEVD